MWARVWGPLTRDQHGQVTMRGVPPSHKVWSNVAQASSLNVHKIQGNTLGKSLNWMRRRFGYYLEWEFEIIRL